VVAPRPLQQPGSGPGLQIVVDRVDGRTVWACDEKDKSDVMVARSDDFGATTIQAVDDTNAGHR
jgi:hypothetical protein